MSKELLQTERFVCVRLDSEGKEFLDMSTASWSEQASRDKSVDAINLVHPITRVVLVEIREKLIRGIENKPLAFHGEG